MAHGLRPHLRLFTMLWLVCQTLSLSALVPADCCAGHDLTMTSHECAGDADGLCPMLASGGELCPMHQADQADGSSSALCVMRGLCNGPAAALSVLLSIPGILTAQPQVPQPDAFSMVDLEPSPSFDIVVPQLTPPPRL